MLVHSRSLIYRHHAFWCRWTAERFSFLKFSTLCANMKPKRWDTTMQQRAPYTVTFGIAVARCKAKSKLSGNQCLKAAMRGKAVCRTHGGASTGPRTPRGRQKCAEVKMMHGRETRAIRAIRDEKLRELRDLERFMKTQGMIK